MPARPPRREEIAAATVGVLKSGGAVKADLLLVDLGDGTMVVKDFARKGWWARLLGRLLIAREVAAYRWLGEMPGVPRLIGRVDRHAIALEKIDGVMLYPASAFRSQGAALAEKIGALVGGLHARGLVHLDVNRENLLLREDGELVVVDLAGALWFRPGGLPHRLLFGLLATADERAVLKWRTRLAPEAIDREQQERYRRLGTWRRLWIFNRKTPGRRAG